MSHMVHNVVDMVKAQNRVAALFVRTNKLEKFFQSWVCMNLDHCQSSSKHFT